MRNIISDDATLQSGILLALKEYNLTQFVTAEVPGHQHLVRTLYTALLHSIDVAVPQCIVSEAARVPKPEPKPEPAESEEGNERQEGEEVQEGHGQEVQEERVEEQSDRFWDPRSRTSFVFDHITLVRPFPRPVYRSQIAPV